MKPHCPEWVGKVELCWSQEEHAGKVKPLLAGWLDGWQARWAMQCSIKMEIPKRAGAQSKNRLVMAVARGSDQGP